MAEEDVVWQATVDNGTWDCRVIGGEPYHGTLIVTRIETGTEILRREVGLAYNAQFGPDVADVADWQEQCIQAIDKEAS